VEKLVLGFAVAVTSNFRWLAVFFDYKLAQKNVENDDDSTDGDPEESRKAWK
jgi:hypothetical protein